MKLFPVEIFSIIQKYIGDDDEYRKLMNCNQEIFQSIKYQTVYFTVTNVLRANKEDCIHEKFKKFQTLMSRVKDKSKQIGLILYVSNIELLMLHEHIFNQIHRLNISFSYRFKNELNFNIFNNIYQVDLYRLAGITTINSGFENVKILTICDAQDLITLDLRHVKLYDVRLSDCPRISEIKGINGTCCLTVRNIPPTPEGFHLIPGVPYESIVIEGFINLYLDMFYHCDLSHLYSLKLFDLIVRESDDFSIFKNIQHLSITTSLNISCDKYPSLPIFHGTSLHLVHFNLKSWTSAEFIPNVKKIKLRECGNLDPQLSFLTNVRIISLEQIDHISHILSFPFCTHLALTAIKCLTLIDAQPRLLNLKVSKCPHLLDYDMDGQLLNRVEIDTCLQFQSLSKFRNSRELIVFPGSSTNFSFAGYDQSNRPSTERTLRLFAYFIHPEKALNCLNCSDIANLDLLEVRVASGLRELCHFHDIHAVQIRITSDSFEEISYLRNIQVLEFTQVRSLHSLHHLENIDTIMLCEFPDDFQFDGLKGCRVVYSRGNKKLEDQAELYSRGERDGSLFENNYLEIFSSIDDFYVVCEDDSSIRLW